MSHRRNRIADHQPLPYSRAYNFENLSFVWLDSILNSVEECLNAIIQPFTWNFFDSIPQCVAFIEHQMREKNQIFLVASGSLGYELFISTNLSSSFISFAYIYCSQLGRHQHWTGYYSQIRGVFNDSLQLTEQIKTDVEEAHRRAQISLVQSKTRPKVRKNHITSNLVNLDNYFRSSLQ